MGFLSVSSIIGTILSAIAILAFWIIAINDGMGSQGCIKTLSYFGIYHSFYEVATDDYRRLFFGTHKGVYLLCIITMIFCFLGSIITAIMGCCKALLYLIAGILKTIIFICCFAVIIHRARYNKQCMEMIIIRKVALIITE